MICYILTFVMMMMVVNCFCGMVDQRRVFSLISSWDHCQRSSPSRISDMPRAGFEPEQNLSSGFAEGSCAVVITTTPRCHDIYYNIIIITSFVKKESSYHLHFFKITKEPRLQGKNGIPILYSFFGIAKIIDTMATHLTHTINQRCS